MWQSAIVGEIGIADGTLVIADGNGYDGTPAGLHAFISIEDVGAGK